MLLSKLFLYKSQISSQFIQEIELRKCYIKSYSNIKNCISDLSRYIYYIRINGLTNSGFFDMHLNVHECIKLLLNSEYEVI